MADIDAVSTDIRRLLKIGFRVSAGNRRRRDYATVTTTFNLKPCCSAQPAQISLSFQRKLDTINGLVILAPTNSPSPSRSVGPSTAGTRPCSNWKVNTKDDFKNNTDT